MTVKEYTEEFYRLNIRAGHREGDDEKVARYLNGLRYDIQDELSMTDHTQTVEDAYQMALKAEEKLNCKQGQRGRGKKPAHEAKPLFMRERRYPKRIGGNLRVELREVVPRSRGSKNFELRRQRPDQQGDYADANTFPRT
jgi:hypothetical protein